MSKKAAPPSRPLGEQGERTRARLLAAARTVFRDRGYAATRIDDITKEAGTSHGAFYLYFANKHDVLEALAVETAADMNSLADRLGDIDHGEDGYGQLRDWIDGFVTAYERHAPVVIAWIAADTEDTRFDELGRKVLGEFAGRVAAGIERAVEAGRRHPVHPPTAAVALVAMLERLCYFWLVRGGGFKRDVVVDTLAAIWYDAIYGREGEPVTQGTSDPAPNP